MHLKRSKGLERLCPSCFMHIVPSTCRDFGLTAPSALSALANRSWWKGMRMHLSSRGDGNCSLSFNPIIHEYTDQRPISLGKGNLTAHRVQLLSISHPTPYSFLSSLGENAANSCISSSMERMVRTER